MLYFDFETTNLQFGDANESSNCLLMVAYAVDAGPVLCAGAGTSRMRLFFDALREAEHVCAFNAKFEMKWCLREGIDIDDKHWHDPMLAEKVLLGNIQLPLNQGAVCERYGFDVKDPMIDSLMKAGVCPSEMPQSRLRARCRRDVRTMRQVHRVQQVRIQDNNQLHLYRNRCDFAVVLAHIEREGMLLDAARVEESYAKYAKEEAQLKRELDDLTGGINLRSSDQVATYLYTKLKFPEKRGANRRPLRNKPSKQFPNGKPKTDQNTMTWLAARATTPEQKAFVDKRQAYGKANAALTKSLEFFKGVCDEYGGKFHAQFNQTVAATHRLTSSGVPLMFKQFDRKKSAQLQNMPREFKTCFKAPPGYVIAEVDAAQLEFRVAAFLGNDVQARQDIDDPDFDAHCKTAAIMNDIPYEHFLDDFRAGVAERKAQRTAAKPDTFKPLYGGTKGTPEQERYYAEFRQRYKGVAATQENWLAEVMATGKLVTDWGMRFEWETYLNRHGTAMNKRTHKPVGPQVCNYPVQNLATAEIVPIAIVALYKRCKKEKLGVRFVNTVHDSVVCYIPHDAATISYFRKAAEWAFTTAVYEHLQLFYGIEFNVPLGMEMVYGRHWNVGTQSFYDDVNNWKVAA